MPPGICLIIACFALATLGRTAQMTHQMLPNSLDGARKKESKDALVVSSGAQPLAELKQSPLPIAAARNRTKWLAMLLLSMNAQAETFQKSSIGKTPLRQTPVARQSIAMKDGGFKLAENFNDYLSNLANKFPGSPAARTAAKQDLVDSIATGADNDVVLQRFLAVEATNTVSRPVTSPLLSGDWFLVWTTSDSIAGATRPALLRPEVAPLQRLDLATLTAENAEEISPLRLRSSVDVELSPKPGKAGDTGVQAKFTRFRIGPLSIPAGEKFRGELDVTFLDDQMRLSRGDKGNLFVLLRDRAEADKLWRAFQRTF